MKFYVITGASSCGKTALIRRLKKQGFPVIEEVARSVLTEGVLHPYKDPVAFQDEVSRRQFKMEEDIRKSGGVAAFLDRGFCDILAFCRYFGTDPADMPRGTADYAAAFILEALPHFERDGVRIEKDRAEALRIKDMIVREYETHGVPCIPVPVMPVAVRAEFVMERIRES